MRLLVVGGRHLGDAALVRSALDRLHGAAPVTVLIHGGLPVLGVTVEDWAREQRIHVVRYPPNWRAFGRRAEAVRNAFMLDDSRPDRVLALPGAEDTRILVGAALARGIAVVDAAGHPVDAPEPRTGAERRQTGPGAHPAAGPEARAHPVSRRRGKSAGAVQGCRP